jgi:hypothetical protein
MKKITIKLSDIKALKFAAHLRKEHPKYSRTLKLRRIR